MQRAGARRSPILLSPKGTVDAGLEAGKRQQRARWHLVAGRVGGGRAGLAAHDRGGHRGTEGFDCISPAPTAEFLAAALKGARKTYLEKTFHLTDPRLSAGIGQRLSGTRFWQSLRGFVSRLWLPRRSCPPRGKSSDLHAPIVARAGALASAPPPNAAKARFARGRASVKAVHVPWFWKKSKNGERAMRAPGFFFFFCGAPSTH